jgi:hypothetical protein
MTALAEIEDVVRVYVVKSFLTGPEAETLRNDDDLLAVLNSLQVLRMVIDLEATFQVEKVAAFVARKRAVPAPSG